LEIYQISWAEGFIQIQTQVTKANVPGHMRFCKTDADCTYVDTSCGSCCVNIGIHRGYEDIYYLREKTPACREFTGNQCSCTSDETLPVCKQGVCLLRKDRSKSMDAPEEEPAQSTAPIE
jgi:hypothetical protein